MPRTRYSINADSNQDVISEYLCKNCDRTFNNQTGTVFEHLEVALRKWFFALYAYIRFNTSLRQLDVEIDVSYKTSYRRVQRILRALDALRLQLEGPVEIDELYVKAGFKGCERDQPSRGHPRVREIRLHLADRKEGSLTVYTDGFRAYEPLARGRRIRPRIRRPRRW